MSTSTRIANSIQTSRCDALSHPTAIPSYIRIASFTSPHGRTVFCFQSEALNQPVGRLSGGERARVLIAQLMLQPADILLLDEPTNDLDIPTLEILEESLMEYTGALVLVTHDRYMLDRVSTIVLGLDGIGGMELFADYSQWEAWQRKQLSNEKKAAATAARLTKKRLRQRRSCRSAKRASWRPSSSALPKPRISCSSSAKRWRIPQSRATDRGCLAAYSQITQAQNAIDQLYARWTELEQKQGYECRVQANDPNSGRFILDGL